ncbi:MAG: hypothetical protein QXZ43_04815 [Candidatus Aenigmatarchaeota archaeon]
MIFQKIFKSLIAFYLLFFFSNLYAEVCVWRNPEKTMIKIFPKANDYKTITKVFGEDKRKVIEDRLGNKLAEGERKDWIYYEIKGSENKTLGYIIADAEKGEYGVIEIVMGITPDGKIEGIYIQRSREKDKNFKSEQFLKQFCGKTIKDPIKLGEDIKAVETIAVKAVILGVRKMLIFYDELGKQR